MCGTNKRNSCLTLTTSINIYIYIYIMSSLRPCTMTDLFYFNNVNLDVLTETYNLRFYMSYMTYFPESFVMAVMDQKKNPTYGDTTTTTTTATATNGTALYGNKSSSSRNGSVSHGNSNDNRHSSSFSNNNNKHNNTTILGYLLGKAEGTNQLWHGHVSAITVQYNYRRLQLASRLMQYFEDTISTCQKQNYFVDLFVRQSNTLAIQLYTSWGYVRYRRVLGYYHTSYCTTSTAAASRTTDTSKNTSTASSTTTTIATAATTVNPIATTPDITNTTSAVANASSSTIAQPSTTTAPTPTTIVPCISTSTLVNVPEHAYDMRKSLRRDMPLQLSMIPLQPHDILPEELEEY
jgi:ribosomal protein S18 acetylase RimI-like enzyme